MGVTENGEFVMKMCVQNEIAACKTSFHEETHIQKDGGSWKFVVGRLMYYINIHILYPLKAWVYLNIIFSIIKSVHCLSEVVIWRV